ncbi:MAG: site-specific DNA-methyltransferase [Candidatus Calescibacterium sp.]|nr:site-specific DNA-methyltransferase [Candidatus Calescibacterium sp.]MDW8087012.1 site-specific DNA-methyltransferase [Candidatus Calescibacterium sp.]
MIDKYLNKVICGDVLTILRNLPDNIVDVSVTSPPYNKGENKKGWLVANVKYSGVSDRLPEDVYQQNQIDVLNELFRVTKPGGSLFYNHKLRWERGQLLHPMDWLRKTRWVIRQEIIWDRMIAANIRGWRFWQVEERIYWLYKPNGKSLIGDELKPKHALLTSIWRFPPERNNPHPAPFPLELPVRCIYSVMDDKKEGLVIDPYCGSGTTLVAAKILGHNYIGIDISEEYCRLAEERIKNYEDEIRFAEEEIAKHVVSKTFKQRKEAGEFTGKYSKLNRDKPEKLHLFRTSEIKQG